MIAAFFIMKQYSKYKVSMDASKRTYNDIKFDSVQEMKYYTDVVLPGVQSGEILTFERQKKYILQDSFIRNGKKILPIIYKADYYIKYRDGREQVIDIKGCADATAKLKRKMFWYVYPELDYVWLTFSKIDGGWITYEDKQIGAKQRKKEKMELKRRLQDD